MLFSAIIGSCSTLRNKQATAGSLYPWLSAENKFGYSDSVGNIKIPPQYDDAMPFYNGFAVVGIHGKYGVINTHNEVIVALKYPFTTMEYRDGFTLLITKKEYNAWWHFWQWQWWPEWSILGGNSGPTLVTKVPKARWQIIELPGEKTLFSERIMDDKTDMGISQYWKADWIPSRTIPNDIKILSAGNLLSVQDRLFKQTHQGKIKSMAGKLFGFINDSTLLIQRGKRYFLADKNGEKTSKEAFEQRPGIFFKTTDGESVYICKTGEMGEAYPVIAEAVFADKKGHVFLFPNLKKALPTVVDDYKRGNTKKTAKELLQNAVAITDMSRTKFFAIVSTADENGNRACYFLDVDGHWNAQIPAYIGPGSFLEDDRVIFDRGPLKGVLDTNWVFYKIPLDFIRPCSQHHYWYMGKDTATDKYGVYDALHQQWKIPLQFDYLQDEILPGIGIYSIIRNGSDSVQQEYFGLINIAENKKITPAIYNQLQMNGRVTKIEDGKMVSFYINPQTGFEFRSKR